MSMIDKDSKTILYSKLYLRKAHCNCNGYNIQIRRFESGSRLLGTVC